MPLRPKRSSPSLQKTHKIEHVQTVKVNLWGMIQNVATHAMNKGQFLAVAFTGLVALIIYRAPPEFSGQVAGRIFNNLSELKGASLILNVILAISWAAHVRWVLRSNSEEMDRIGREKTQLQETLTKLKLSNPTQKGPRNDH